MKHLPNQETILYRGFFGSKLYGLETETSDIDVKGVFIPPIKDALFGTYEKSVVVKGDYDESMFSLQHFIKVLSKCDMVSFDMVSFDMIHTPKEMFIESSKEWDKIRSLRSNLYCKNMRGIFGYIKTQTAKYSDKIERFRELQELYDICLSIVSDTNGEASFQNLEDSGLVDMVRKGSFQYISVFESKNKIKGNIDVLGARYQFGVKLNQMMEEINKKMDSYGNRTKKGSLSGSDWKSIHHAYRVLVQIEEIIVTRDLVFPLSSRELLFAIKTGKIPYELVISMLNHKFDEVMELIKDSELPEHPNMKPFEELFLEIYQKR